MSGTIDRLTMLDRRNAAGGKAPLYIEEGAALRDAVAGRADMTARMPQPDTPERFDVVVIGGGQAGLAAGYHLKRRGLSFVILDASERIGDVWRQRWDSLRLFTPARYDSLDGLPFPAPATSFPTKDEMADYLEAYAARFELPVRSGVRVERVSKRDGVFRSRPARDDTRPAR